jgi:serine/threonine protein phosphatase 1
MFAKMFGRLKCPVPQVAQAARVPDGRRVYAIGDIHGRVDLLEELHSLILRDVMTFQGAEKVVVYLGDYVDRGLQSRETVDCLLDQSLAGFESVFLKGNHEQTLLDFLTDSRVALDWMTYGGDATLYSYGAGLDGPRSNPEVLRKLQETFRNNLPKRHEIFFRALSLTHHEGDYMFVHAGIKPGVTLDHQEESDLLWIRDEFIDSEEDHGKIIVHGHTISRVAEVKRNRIGIDTGAFASGKLSCLVLEGTEGRFLNTGN